MVPKPDQKRIKALLTEAITVLCKNGLSYEYTCSIQGLLGITLDEQDVFLVDLKESIIKKERPVEKACEEALEQTSESQSPTRPGSPRSGAARRKRRRETSGGNSPVKRAAFKEEIDTGEEVIVIKEELSDVENMYGDSGGGDHGEMLHQQDTNLSPYPIGGYTGEGGSHQQDSNSSLYPMGPGGDFPGGGSSHWETASSSSSQSPWPSLAQQDMYQPAVPSSSFTPPTQLKQGLEAGGGGAGGGGYEWDGAAAKPTLTLQTVRNMLIQAVVSPTLSQPCSVTAVRLSWFADDAEQIKPFWENLPGLRTELDNRLKTITEVKFFISSLTSTISGKKKKICFPGVSYWIVSDEQISAMQLTTAFQDKLGATMKLLLQPYQTGANHAEHSLFSVFKDTGDGVVKKVIDRLTQGREAIVKLYTCLPQQRDYLQQVARQIQEQRISVQVEMYNNS